jgi:hypothetical protein
MRRRNLAFVGLLALLIAGSVPAGASQEATPDGGGLGHFDGLGLPALDIAVSTAGYEGIPESIEAGRYLVTVTVAAEMEFGGGVAFVRPVGVTMEEFMPFLAGPPAEGEAEGGSPVAEAEGTPSGAPSEGGDEMAMGLPPFVFDATFAGGVYTMAGAAAQAVVDLGPGEWVAWADDTEAGIEPVVFTVTGELPAELPEPESVATLTMVEYDIKVTEGALTAGPQVVKVVDAGVQPHFLTMAKGPDGMTEEQVLTVLEEEAAAMMSGEAPVYSDLNPEEDFGEGPYTPTQSIGTTSWHVFDLEAGTYLIACFFPDLGDGMPHANKGMVEVVEVAA